jgi:peroxiredoxin
MLSAGSPFPALTLESSKGGRTDLGAELSKGTTIVAVLPAAPGAALFDALQAHYTKWLLGHFFNVYYVSAAPPAQARAWADEHGVLAPLLHDAGGALTAHPGVYRVTGGVVERAAGFDALDSLV